MTKTVVAGQSNAGRPRVPLGLYPTLAILFGLRLYYEDRQPCDATTLVKFRQLLGEEGVEELLAQSINVAVELKLIQPSELSSVIVDSTVQHKASTIGLAVQEALGQTIHDTLNKAKRIWSQSARRKTVSGQPKLYSWPAPEVDCISGWLFAFGLVARVWSCRLCGQ